MNGNPESKSPVETLDYPENPEHTEESAKKRMRFAPRTNLACTQCRRRKTRCSGGWPTCDACTTRREDCVYEGVRAQVSSRSTESKESHSRTNLVNPPAAVEKKVSLPSTDLRRKAIAHFREHYASTLLCFLPPQELIVDDAGESLPPPLLFSILALVSRFIPDFTPPGADPLIVSNTFAESTKRELAFEYNKPRLCTIQACLILCIFEIGNGAEHQGWLRLGHAIRLAQLMGLHSLDSIKPKLHWGRSPKQSESLTVTESKRRTLWCAFCLERLLANGRDKVALLKGDQISTRLPQPDEDFIYGKESSSARLSQMTQRLEAPIPSNESLFSQTVRIVDILGDVVSWHGNGGRYLDATAPWLPSTSFDKLNRSLLEWRQSLPTHLDHTESNVPLIVAAGQGRAWIFLFLLFHQARALLHREYLPLQIEMEYDPTKGPNDGSALAKSLNPPPHWWYNSTSAMIESANAISDLYVVMETRNLSADAYPFPGFCFLTASTIHSLGLVYGWSSLPNLSQTSRLYLQKDMKAFHHLAAHWPVANNWIHHLSLYHKLNIVNRISWDSPSLDVSKLDISKVKDGIMTYIRDGGFEIRRSKLPDSKFDFESWLQILNNAPVEQPPTNNWEAANLRKEHIQNGDTGLYRTSSALSERSGLTLGFGGGFHYAWWDSWDIANWDPEIFG